MTYARQMFFMMLLFDEELEVSEKAQIYLEVLGNTQLCPKTFEVSSSSICNKPILATLIQNTDPNLCCLSSTQYENKNSNGI